MILFSIPVHEKPEVVENQIQNFLKYNPGASILLHISKQMPSEEVAQIKQLPLTYPQVFINPQQLYTSWADGCQFKIHLSNFQYALNHHIPFHYIALHASNDLFIQYGLQEYLLNHDAGFDQWTPLQHNPVAQQKVNLEKHLFFRRLMKKYHLSTVIPSQLEGTFYHRNAIEILCQRLTPKNTFDFPYLFSIGYHSKNSIRYKLFSFIEKVLRNLNITVIHPNPLEEVIFPTFAADKIQNPRNFPYCYVNWANGLNISKEEIVAIRANDKNAWTQHNQQLCHLTSEQINAIEFFAVKRINRDIADPLRSYITQELD